MKKNKNTSSAEQEPKGTTPMGNSSYCFLCCSVSHQKELLATLEQARKPGFLAGREVPNPLV